MASPQHRLPGEPRWLALEAAPTARVPAPVLAWLADEASLTRRVTDACAGRFSVRVVRQQWGMPLPSERKMLGLPLRAACLVREVELLCNGVPQVFARTLIPATSLRGAARRLARLRNRPLGAVLFADPRTRRERIEIARFATRHRLYRAATAHLDPRPPVLWGRRTLFRYVGRPILVNELFLPSLLTRPLR